MSLPRTPSQTVGPYLSLALPWPDGPFVVAEGTPDAIWIRGRVLDGAGEPVPDAVVETWQADPSGHFARPGDDGQTSFRGFGRSGTDADGGWAILTLRPGIVRTDDGLPQAPHLDVNIFARGLLRHLVTRIYLGDEEAANADDPLLRSITDPAIRQTLIAQPVDAGFRFDIHLQGPSQTAFLDV